MSESAVPTGPSSAGPSSAAPGSAAPGSAEVRVDPAPGDDALSPARGAGASLATARADLLRSLDVAHGRLTAARLPLDGAGVEEGRQVRLALLDQLDDYLLPRLRTEGAPLLVVVGGSTGAGKSTLVNSVLGAPLTRPGVLRPTTRSPVLVHHPTDAPWFGPERVLPNLPRIHTDVVTGTAAEAVPETAGSVRSLRLAPFGGLPPGLALLDAPDIDSVERANRELAAQLLAAADLWLFITTAARYADAVPWDLLTAAAARRAQIALVLDRVDPGSEAVEADLRRLMAEHGLGEAPLFVVPEAGLDAEGLLPEHAVAAVSAWLTDLGGNAGAREHLATATRDGVVDDVVGQLRAVADAADAQVDAVARLREHVRIAYDDAAAQVREATSDGAMLRGEVLGRWQDFVGASDVMRSIERGVGKVRDSVTAFLRGGRTGPAQVEVAIAHGLEAVALDAVETARERTRAAWRADPAGAAMLAQAPLASSVAGSGSAELRAAIAEQVRAWQSDVLDLVREQGEDRRGLARAMSFGVNGLGVAVMVLVFAGTGGLTGAEVGIAGGTAVLAQKVLEAAFGDDAVRRLTKLSQDRLEERLTALLEADAAVATTRLAALGVDEADGRALRAAADDVARAATAERRARAVAAADAAAGAARGSRGIGLGPSLRGAHLHVPASTTTPAASGQSSSAAAAGDARPADGTKPDEPRPGFFRRLFGGRP